MDKNHHSDTNEHGAEALMAIASFIILASVLYTAVGDFILVFVAKRRMKLNNKIADTILSSAHALILPVMSYMFSQAKQNKEERPQVILVWMVLLVVLRVRNGNSTWEPQKSAEQLMRLLWVGFLVCSYTPPNGIRTSLIFLCAFSFSFEVLKAVTFYIAKNSSLIGRNPKLIHNYMKRVMLQDDLRTTPVNNCDYIVMGEENHELAVCENGYFLGDRKSNSSGKLTIGRVFQLNSSEDETFSLMHPYWRDTCLSLSLAKMLRRRFLNLQLDEAGSNKALAFVLEGLIDYIGTNKDIPLDGSNGARNPVERLFSIIQDELNRRSNIKNVEQARIHYTIFETKAETIFCITVRGTVIAPFVKWIQKKTSRAFPPTVFHSTDVKKTILRSLRMTGGQLTNGETSLKSHGMLEHVNQVFQTGGSTTEAILVWHIATTLFHFEKPPHQQNNNSFKEQGVASALSNYCLYLVAFLPEILPEEVEWTEKMYQSVRKEIFDIDRSSGQKPTIKNRCEYAIGEITWDENSVVGKGVKLAKLLLYYNDNGIEVWRMLSEFWAEMMLFISPSDNVEAHEEILEREELITQLWALLTHAGILTRPRSTEHPNHGTESNELTEVVIV
ncbi:hypothetical protein LUZ61_016145 [Rhynchospora tenuis]|uniref:DUF4220 domain-containing protein n=1 Tax=Rhynchospora tenuis TaxID=198213 RepID=A0AAD5Z502_9POAL|nr:hypothetical protein LUZ61_016145 [Rhynchospora tenuis]